MKAVGRRVVAAAIARKARARSFVGKYRMLGPPSTMENLGQTIRIEYDSWWRNLIGQVPVLKVFCEQSVGTYAPPAHVVFRVCAP